ncbi:secreted glycosyl hydrolase [Aaosphaeria arxii CBS 175.79]|uniref:Secreted glycosyl hydrolase n=1 Tax=Aaosphaeria arxii CBS 175.79 TaxID=1450172 RepID=A0A6A5Y561_9PLEO|nr:secreted glycosyl hydrolase [Aaosphaeria arxii CBS 175.79]KAF2020353.1 secreted glycosyl hydrolase [Aaosphaeria arxii CBS 175.79]
MMRSTAPFQVLVFSKTASYRHDSIAAGIAAIKDFTLRTTAFEVTASENAQCITPVELIRYRVVIFLQCTGFFLSPDNIEALKAFVRGGGGVIGIHGAAAGMPGHQWYNYLLGADFESHPPPELGRVLVENEHHWLSQSLVAPGQWEDEWYNYRNHPGDNQNLIILLRGDTSSFHGGKMGKYHPLAWCQDFEGGRSYYTALGHFEGAYGNAWFLDQIFKAIFWVARQESIMEDVKSRFENRSVKSQRSG